MINSVGWHNQPALYFTCQVLVCPDKRQPEENKDKASIAYNTQVCAAITCTSIAVSVQQNSASPATCLQACSCLDESTSIGQAAACSCSSTVWKA
jgi:hypothetical protein